MVRAEETVCIAVALIIRRFFFSADLPPMRHTDGPVLPPRAEPVDTMEIFFVKVAQITGGLQWPLDVYGDVAVRDSLDHKRNYFFRRRREDCQTLTSPQASFSSVSLYIIYTYCVSCCFMAIDDNCASRTCSICLELIDR